VKGGRDFERLDGKLDEPLLEKAVGAEVVAIELVAAGPRDEKSSGSEKDKTVGIGERKSVFGPADEESL